MRYFNFRKHKQSQFCGRKNARLLLPVIVFYEIRNQTPLENKQNRRMKNMGKITKSSKALVRE